MSAKVMFFYENYVSYRALFSFFLHFDKVLSLDNSKINKFLFGIVLANSYLCTHDICILVHG